MSPYDFCIATVREAGEVLKKAQSEGFSTMTKNNDPRNIVTSVDLSVSTFIKNRIQETFPEDAMYSEEGGGVSEGARVWAIDPIDGTANFSRAIPHYAICIALIERSVPVVGAVYNPTTNELFSFEKGKGAYLNGARIGVSLVTELKNASVFFRASSRSDLWDWAGDSYRKLLEYANKTSNFGGSALDACFVAAGRIEANVYGQLTTIDIAGAIGILLEAGGRVVNEKGEPVAFSTEPQKVVMTNSKEIEQSILTLLF
jgi:myo-inositol-1(or 4)-monophosphatase